MTKRAYQMRTTYAVGPDHTHRNNAPAYNPASVFTSHVSRVRATRLHNHFESGMQPWNNFYTTNAYQNK